MLIALISSYIVCYEVLTNIATPVSMGQLEEEKVRDETRLWFLMCKNHKSEMYSHVRLLFFIDFISPFRWKVLSAYCIGPCCFSSQPCLFQKTCPLFQLLLIVPFIFIRRSFYGSISWSSILTSNARLDMLL